MEQNTRLGEMLCGIALTALGIYTLISASQWEFFGINGPGPGFFPIVYGLIMSGFALALTAQSFRRPRAEVDQPSEPRDQTGLVAAIATLIALAVSLPLMWLLGFVVGFGLVLFFILIFVFRRSALSAGVIAASIALALHLTFSVLLGSPLPVGKFWSF